ncbi:hypothetical protein [Kribbella sp. NPDC050470]|uniref:hypothetical protein n=1 Tax=unclassified Kribbella TaxID=2644121 RepID=UPI0037B89CD1
MSTWEIVMLVVMVAVMTMLALQNLREKPRPSRFRMALWAESVRRRGLTEEEAMREAWVLGYIDTPPPPKGVEW